MATAALTTTLRVLFFFVIMNEFNDMPCIFAGGKVIIQDLHRRAAAFTANLCRLKRLIESNVSKHQLEGLSQFFIGVIIDANGHRLGEVTGFKTD